MRVEEHIVRDNRGIRNRLSFHSSSGYPSNVEQLLITSTIIAHLRYGDLTKLLQYSSSTAPSRDYDHIQTIQGYLSCLPSYLGSEFESYTKMYQAISHSGKLRRRGVIVRYFVENKKTDDEAANRIALCWQMKDIQPMHQTKGKEEHSAL